MSFVHGIRQQLVIEARLVAGSRTFSLQSARCSPVLLSTQFIPTLRSEELGEEQLESVKLLLRGGYIRQSSSGFYSLLPLGLRMIRKIEAVIDEEMEKVRAVGPT
jgi:prolyl-tRNA synthetase